MSIRLIELLANLDQLQGREFQTIYQKKRFVLLFHDTTKLRIRLEDRDISIPISIILLGIIQLLTRKIFTRQMCIEILGKDWGFPFIARLLLECDDIVLEPDKSQVILKRLRIHSKYHAEPVLAAPPPNGKVAVNGNR